MISNELFNESLSYMKKNGALFFEIYYDETETCCVDILNGQVYPERLETTRGVSLRAFDGENHICVSTEDLSDSNLRRMVYNMGKNILSLNRKIVMRCDTPNNIGSSAFKNTNDWKYFKKTIIEDISTEHKRMQAVLNRETQIRTRCYFQNQNVQLMSSFNGVIYDKRSRCCIRTDAGNLETCTTNIISPCSYDELVGTLNSGGLVSGYQASRSKMAKCPTGKFDLVLLAGSASLFFHECCGHLLEVHNAMCPDSVFNRMLGKKIANDCVTLCDSGNLKNLWGSISVDDEGNRAQENILIQNGVLEGYLVDLIEGYKYGLKTTSTTRRQCYRKVPTARMTNTYIAKGTCTEEEIIKDTQRGLLIRTFSFGNVNPITGDFTVHITSGNFIRNGVVEESFQGGRVCANALEILSRIDMVADNLSFTNGFCYASSGRITVSCGQPTIRIADVPVFSEE